MTKLACCRCLHFVAAGLLISLGGYLWLAHHAPDWLIAPLAGLGCLLFMRAILSVPGRTVNLLDFLMLVVAIMLIFEMPMRALIQDVRDRQMGLWLEGLINAFPLILSYALEYWQWKRVTQPRRGTTRLLNNDDSDHHRPLS